MKILVIEDDPIYASAIEMLIDEMGYELAAQTNTSNEVLRLIKATSPDLLLLDIHIQGDMDGIQVAEYLYQEQISIPVIFITSFRDNQTFERAKNTNPFAYMIKPFDKDTLQRTIELALYKHVNASWDVENFGGWTKDIAIKDSFFIKVNRKLQKVLISSIYYIEVQNKHSVIVLTNQKLSVRISLKDLVKKLPANIFVKVHQSYLVNTQKIENVDMDKNKVQVGRYQVPISQRHKKVLMKELSGY